MDETRPKGPPPHTCDWGPEGFCRVCGVMSPTHAAARDIGSAPPPKRKPRVLDEYDALMALLKVAHGIQEELFRIGETLKHIAAGTDPTTVQPAGPPGPSVDCAEVFGDRCPMVYVVDSDGTRARCQGPAGHTGNCTLISSAAMPSDGGP